MRDFLKKFLIVYAPWPPHALWRAIEAKLLYNYLPFEQPILDLGCGDGLFASILFEDRPEKIAVGCDVSDQVVKVAKSCSVYEKVVVADGCKLPFKNEAFATILSNCVLEHIAEDEKVLKEVVRVLKKEGKFIFTVPSKKFVENLKKQDEKYVEKLNKRLAVLHYRSLEEWKRLLQQSGLTLEEFRYYLPKAVQQVWEGLMVFFTKKVMGRELGAYLGTKKIPIINLIVRLIFPSIFGRYLQKWYLIGTIDDGQGGALLIVARKTKSSL